MAKSELCIWNVLEMFWGKDRKNKLHKLIFGNQHPESKTLINNLYNMVTMSPDVHTFWATGIFVLDPVEEDNGPFEMKARFTKIPERLRTGAVEINTDPASFEIVSQEESALFDRITKTEINDGHEVIFRTTDPQNAPLPNKDLLMLQSFLIRVLRLAGRAGEDMLETFDSDEEILSINTSAVSHPEAQSEAESPQSNSRTEQSGLDNPDLSSASSAANTFGNKAAPSKREQRHKTARIRKIWPRTQNLYKKTVNMIVHRAKRTIAS